MLVTPLRERMIRELQLHRRSPRTIESYVGAVAELAKHCGRSPDEISLEEVRGFFHHLIVQRKLSFSTCNQKLAAVRFFYGQVLRQEDFQLRIPMKKSGRLLLRPTLTEPNGSRFLRFRELPRGRPGVFVLVGRIVSLRRCTSQWRQ